MGFNLTTFADHGPVLPPPKKAADLIASKTKRSGNPGAIPHLNLARCLSCLGVQSRPQVVSNRLIPLQICIPPSELIEQFIVRSNSIGVRHKPFEIRCFSCERRAFLQPAQIAAIPSGYAFSVFRWLAVASSPFARSNSGA